MSVLNSLISPADHSIRSFHLFSLPFLFFQTKQIFQSFIYDRAHLKWDFDYKDKILSFCAERARIYYGKRDCWESLQFFLGILGEFTIEFVDKSLRVDMFFDMDGWVFIGRGQKHFPSIKKLKSKTESLQILVTI